MKIKIGTRGSKLALWQAYHIETLLKNNGADVEIVIIETKGDKILDRSLAAIGSKGLFTEELEEQLLNGSIDIAVHSAKDMQTDLGDNLELIAFTEREKTNDVLVSLNPNFQLEDIRNGAIIGSSSARRKATLRKMFPNIKLTEARGNLQTRFNKMEEGQYDAMMLAYAGVHRMNYNQHIVHMFSLEEFIPAVGQGSVAIEAAKTLDRKKYDLIRNACNDVISERCIKTERAFLTKLQGGCSIPVFALATIAQQKLSITGGVIALDGSKEIKHTLSMDLEKSSASLGTELAEYIFNNGGKEILEKIKASKNEK